MPGLPHYKNAHVAMEKWEPVYLNMFEILLKPPAAISSWEWIMDNVKGVTGIETDVTPSVVEQKYKGASRRFAAGFPEKTTVDLVIEFEVNLNDNNSMYVYKGLSEWSKLIWNPLTGEMMLKKDYAGGPMTISTFNRRGDIYRQWIFPVVWPISSIGPMEFSYEPGDVWKISMTFAADYWEDMSI
jgi:hypothetical protein